MKNKILSMLLSVFVLLSMTVPAMAEVTPPTGNPDDVGTIVLSGPDSVKADESSDIQYKAEYTMSNKVADTLNNNKDSISDETLRLGFNIKMSNGLQVLTKNGNPDEFCYEFMDNDLFEVAKTEMQPDDNMLKVTCKLKSGWKEKTYAVDQKITLIGHCKIDPKDFAAGKSVNITGDAWAIYNGKEKKIADLPFVTTKMIETPAPPNPNKPDPTSKIKKVVQKMKVKISSVKQVNTKKKGKKQKRYLQIKWKKLGKQIKGYQIYRADKKKSKFKKNPIATVKKGTTYKDKKIKKKTTYYYKVRGYAVVNGKKIYTKFSTIKSKKVK